MNHIHVTCAIIERDGLVLVAQRGTSSTMPLKWEFPGGKKKPGESAKECIRRELLEELGIKIHILNPLPTSTHQYPSFTITLYPFVCKIVSGEITLHDHASVIWQQPQELHLLDWAEADVAVFKSYLSEKNCCYSKKK